MEYFIARLACITEGMQYALRINDDIAFSEYVAELECFVAEYRLDN